MPVGGDELVQVKPYPYERVEKASFWCWGDTSVTTHYRVLPPLPEGEEHAGEYREAKKGDRRFRDHKNDCVDTELRTTGEKYWILKPRNESQELPNKPTGVPAAPMQNEIIYLNQGDETMSEKTNEELLKEAPAVTVLKR